jgi:cob(I)alamin adenosyltransferase
MKDTMSLYTKNGDTGETQLYGGEQVSKTNPRLHAYGTVDELDAVIGVIVAEECSAQLRTQLTIIQTSLFRLKADLATPQEHVGRAVRIVEEDVTQLEKWIDAADAKVPPLTQFILPGGTRTAAELHLARTVCRRAERWVVALAKAERINMGCIRYLNRLSDCLFALARLVNAEEGVREVKM